MCLNLLLSPHLLLCAMLTRTPTHPCTPRRSPCHLATESRLSVKTRPTVRPYTHTYILLSIQVSIHSYTHARILSQPIYSHNHPTTHIFILVCLKHMSVGGSGRPHPDGDRSRQAQVRHTCMRACMHRYHTHTPALSSHTSIYPYIYTHIPTQPYNHTHIHTSIDAQIKTRARNKGVVTEIQTTKVSIPRDTDVY